jgi:hypothetical protein
MRRAILIVPLLLLLLSACLDDYDVEGMTFPCRAAEDCVEDYECHPTRWVCVRAGTSSTAAGLDAGAAD